MTIIKLKVEQVLKIHDEIISFSGGLVGLCPNKSLASALFRIDNAIIFEGLEDIFEIAAFYAIVIAQGHVFNDGNKRTAFSSMYDFLEVNSYLFEADIDETVEIMVDVAEKKLNRSELAIWLKKYTRKLD